MPAMDEADRNSSSVLSADEILDCQAVWSAETQLLFSGSPALSFWLRSRSDHRTAGIQCASRMTACRGSQKPCRRVDRFTMRPARAHDVARQKAFLDVFAEFEWHLSIRPGRALALFLDGVLDR